MKLIAGGISCKSVKSFNIVVDVDCHFFIYTDECTKVSKTIKLYKTLHMIYIIDMMANVL